MVLEELTTLGQRLREVRCWRDLTLREAAGLAGLSFSFWGQVERGEKPVTSPTTLEAMTSSLRVHPSELTGQPWTRHDLTSAEAHARLTGIQTALARYELGVDPENSGAGSCRAPTCQVRFWSSVSRALVVRKKTRYKGVLVLLNAEHLAPEMLRTDALVREAVTGLLRHARHDACGRELRNLAWRLGIAPLR
ncbi:MAG: helix-turn-helix domain-containing protein [Pseudonocardiaceae bacterium]